VIQAALPEEETGEGSNLAQAAMTSGVALVMAVDGLLQPQPQESQHNDWAKAVASAKAAASAAVSAAASAVVEVVVEVVVDVRGGEASDPVPSSQAAPGPHCCMRIGEDHAVAAIHAE
jgi:hypothetical protein